MDTFLKILAWIGGALAVLVAIAIFAAKKIADSQEEARRRRSAWEEKERVAEEARLAPKRQSFGAMRSEANADTQFTERSYRETYVYEHYEDVMRNEVAKRTVYQMWLDDPDFKAGKLTDSKDEQQTIASVLESKVELVKFAGGLTKAKRTSWEARQISDMKEATSLGLTLEQLYERREVEPDVLKVAKAEFETAVYASVTIDLDEMAKRTGQSVPEPATPERAVTAADIAKMVDEMAVDGKTALLSVITLWFSWYVAHVKREGVDRMELMERRSLQVARDLCVGPDKDFKTIADLAEFCSEAQASGYETVRQMMDERIKAFSELGTWTNLKILPPYEKWAEEYRSRLKKPRTPGEFSAFIAAA